MRNNTLIFFFIIALLTTESCYYDRFNELHPFNGYVDTCEGSLPDTYTNTVKVIIQYNCASCHAGSSAKGGVNLSGIEETRSYVNSGQLMGAVRRENGFSPMPPGGSLRACDVEQLQQWIDAGMPE